MQITIPGIKLWNGWPALMRLVALPIPGTIRYAVKKSVRTLEPHFKDIVDFITEDRAEHGWTAQPNGLPTFPDPFYARLDTLLAGEITVEVHAFSESLMSSVDGLSTSDEMAIGFLFTPEAVEEPAHEPAPNVDPPTK
jgi:hypothetical protein